MAADLSDISIHVPREGHDGSVCSGRVMVLLFQSTCPARGTTIESLDGFRDPVISIHVPREGHDARKPEAE